jgi:hypothetical protein
VRREGLVLGRIVWGVPGRTDCGTLGRTDGVAREGVGATDGRDAPLLDGRGAVVEPLELCRLDERDGDENEPRDEELGPAPAGDRGALARADGRRPERTRPRSVQTPIGAE